MILSFTVRNIYIGSSSMVPGSELLKPLDFVSDGSHESAFHYVNEVTFELHLWMAAGCQWSQPHDQRARTFTPNLSSCTLRRGADLDIKSIANVQ